MDWLKHLYENIKKESNPTPALEATPVSWFASHKKLTISGLIGILATIAIGIAIAVVMYNRTVGGAGHMQIFYFNQSMGRLEAEGRPWPTDDVDFWFASQDGFWDIDVQIFWVASAMGQLSYPPSNSQLATVWPAWDVEVPFFHYFTIKDGILAASFYDDYLTMAPLEEALFRSAFTLTMLGLPFVDEVVIRAGGMEWNDTHETIANNPTISATWLANTELVLYFVEETSDSIRLVREYYSAIGVDIQQRPLVALERLLDESPREGILAPMPEDTGIIAVIPAPEIFSIYVNLSGDFMNRFIGSPVQARFMLQAIVNTLIENSGSPPTARQVFFLIDSARHEEFHGVMHFDRGFEYDSLIE